ncbi:antiterminator Q family protein, partial [Moraxella caviae]
IMRGNVPMPSKGYLMNDDRGLQIDEAVTKLARYSLLQYQIFCFYYLCGMSERTIADKMDKRIIPRNRRNRVKQELDKAGAFIAGCLTG